MVQSPGQTCPLPRGKPLPPPPPPPPPHLLPPSSLAGSCGSSLEPSPPRRIFALWKVLEAERLLTKVGVLNSPSSCQQKMDCPAMALWAVLSNTRTVINISYENMTKFYKVIRTHTCRQGSQVPEWRPPPHPPPSFLQDTRGRETYIWSSTLKDGECKKYLRMA